MLLRMNENMTERQLIQQKSNVRALLFLAISVVVLVLSVALAVSGCAKAKPAVEYPDRTPIADRVAEETSLPEYQAPRRDIQVAPLSESDPAPFNGELLDENGAMAVAELRVSYDEVYKLAQVDRKFAVTVTQILEGELNRADQTIEMQRQDLSDLRDGWWAQNKVVVGIGVGLVLGAGFAIGAGYAWAAIEEEKVTE